MMQIKINGKPTAFTEECNLTTLLEKLNLAGKPVVVEHNKEALFPRDYPETLVQDGDQLEIISIAAGG